MEKIHTTFDKITEGFKQYQVHSIELWISGSMKLRDRYYHKKSGQCKGRRGNEKVVIRTKDERRGKRKSHELARTIPNHQQCKIYK
jgi:hypothetical protein